MIASRRSRPSLVLVAALACAAAAPGQLRISKSNSATAAKATPARKPQSAPQPRPKLRPQPRAALPTKLPQLGDDAPPSLIARSAGRTCETNDRHRDPCALFTLHGERIAVAWDVSTHRVTYLYSTTLDTDDDIEAGDLLQIDGSDDVTPFPISSAPHRFVSSEWCDTDSALSGDQLWCAVMVPARPRSGRVLGFVQSVYLYLPDIDLPLLDRTSAPRSRAAQAKRSAIASKAFGYPAEPTRRLD